MKNIFKLYWKIAMYVAPLVGIIFFIHKSNSGVSTCQKSFEIEKGISYSGVVSKKYIDKMNHLNKTIELIRNKGEGIVIFNYDKSGAYDYIKSGDSINKKKGSYELSIYRGDSIVRFKIDYGCETR